MINLIIKCFFMIIFIPIVYPIFFLSESNSLICFYVIYAMSKFYDNL